LDFFFINIDEERNIDKGNERQKWREENTREIFPRCQLRVEGRHRAKEEGEVCMYEEKNRLKWDYLVVKSRAKKEESHRQELPCPTISGV